MWDSGGLGAPRVGTVNHPALWILHGLSHEFSNHAVLCIGIFLTAALTTAGVYQLSRILGIGKFSATCAAIAGALGPPTFNKFVAGHWYYMIAMAAVPWALGLALRSSRRRIFGALAAGCVAALTALQPQLWVFTVAACLLVIALTASDWSSALIDSALFIVVASLLIIPEFYGIAVAHSASRYADVQTIPMWEANNSAGVTDAFVGLGYAPGYAKAALTQVPWARVLFWIVPIAACVGLVSARRWNRGVIAIALCCLVLFLLVVGIHGPFAEPLEWLYARYLWASAFRELYHYAEPMWMLAAVLAMVSIAALPRVPSIAVGLILVIATLALWSPPDYGGTLRSWNFDQRVSVIFRGFEPPMPTRYMLTPSIDPIGPRGSKTSGVDPDAYAIGNALSLNAAQQRGVIGAILQLGERDPSGNAGWLRAAGVSAVFPRPYLKSGAIAGSPLTAPEKRAASKFFPQPRPPRSWRTDTVPLLEFRRSIPVVRDPFHEHFSDGFLLEREIVSDPHDVDAVPPTYRSEPLVPRSAWDPARGWVSTGYWWWLNPQLAFWPHAVFTWSDTPFLIPTSLRRDGYAHIVLFSGRLIANSRVMPLKHGKAVWVSLNRVSALRVVDGAAMIIEFEHVSKPVLRHNYDISHRNEARPALFSLDCACASVTVPSNYHWLVLKQTYNDQWNVHLSSGRVLRHVRFAGYGNAWQILAPPGATLTLAYAPARTWKALLDWSIVAWLALSVAAILGNFPVRFGRTTCAKSA